MASETSCPIAIIGMSCRFPGGASNPESFWKALLESRRCWSPTPKSRYNDEAFSRIQQGTQGIYDHDGGHFLDESIASFDADFFEMRGDEADSMDPQQRLALELAFEAFENAGLPLHQIHGSKTAVFVSMFSHDYDRNVYRDPFDLPPHLVTGTGAAIVSNRISHFFNLKGPSVTLDTGCSGGLVALHQACQALRLRESDFGLAGGVNLILGIDHMIAISDAQYVLSVLSFV